MVRDPGVQTQPDARKDPTASSCLVGHSSIAAIPFMGISSHVFPTEGAASPAANDLWSTKPSSLPPVGVGDESGMSMSRCLIEF